MPATNYTSKDNPAHGLQAQKTEAHIAGGGGRISAMPFSCCPSRKEYDHGYAHY